MPSTILSKLSQMDQSTPDQGDQVAKGINSLASEILSSVDPKKKFDDFVSSNADAKNGMDIVNKYGNGDPRVAFMNYAKEKGKENIAQLIMSKLGLS